MDPKQRHGEPDQFSVATSRELGIIPQWRALVWRVSDGFLVGLAWIRSDDGGDGVPKPLYTSPGVISRYNRYNVEAQRLNPLHLPLQTVTRSVTNHYGTRLLLLQSVKGLAGGGRWHDEVKAASVGGRKRRHWRPWPGNGRG